MNTARSGEKSTGRVIALCGGIGGAKLALGLSKVVAPEQLTIVVNVADDFRHFGLHISPDIDTVCYTLGGVSNTEFGWGRDNESWRFMETVKSLGGEGWFSLGDTDLATSAIRTARLEQGKSLTEITADFARVLGIGATILPASDDRLATVVETEEGLLPFQQYFVGRHCEPRVKALTFDGAETARPSQQFLTALNDEALEAIILCPSNPYLSIDPILALTGVREALVSSKTPVIAVSPLVGNDAIKGPLRKLMGELGHEVSLQTIADHYRDFLDVLVIDQIDADTAVNGPQTEIAQTVMRSLEDRTDLALRVLEIAREFSTSKAERE